MHDLERLRSAAGLPASLVTYFSNNGLNKNLGLVQCMEAVAEKVCSNNSTLGFCADTSSLGHSGERDRPEWSGCETNAASGPVGRSPQVTASEYAPYREGPGRGF